MLIPILTTGSVALILCNLPISGYQSFIRVFCGGVFHSVFTFVYNATFGMLSLYMVAFLSICTAEQQKLDIAAFESGMAGTAAFLISVGFLTEGFELTSFSAVGMFTAVLCGTIAPRLYLLIHRKLDSSRFFFDGAGPMYNSAIGSIIPLALVCVIFALCNFLIDTVFAVDNLWQLFSEIINRIFSAVGLNFFGGLLYILLSSLMWFFGIHGSDVLESIKEHLLDPAMAKNIAAAASGAEPTEIFTKTFFDVFVLIGGCGAALSLLLAIFIFSKRKSSKSLAKLASIPMLFNINELMVFGLPIVYNPAMFIPFVAAPLASFLIAYAAMKLGLVPLTTVEVVWTTPVILGGFRSTGSVAGAVLQLVNLAVGVAIYFPFVLRYDREKEAENKASINILIDKYKVNEENNRDVSLTDEDGIVGALAKQLVNDLGSAMSRGELFMLYQPQMDADGQCVGAESLLRWNHPIFGMIYPPLIIKLATEGGLISALEDMVFTCVKRDAEKYGMKNRISINITAPALQREGFAEHMSRTFPNARAGDAQVCIEITEQSELITNSIMLSTFKALRASGFELSIDDFSMGYTSLKYLQECRFDEVKIDGSLVRGMLGNANAGDIISSIVYLSESLDFSVLAEFVETEEQRKHLEEIGCLFYQGYLFSRPLTAEDYMKYCAEAPALAQITK